MPPGQEALVLYDDVDVATPIERDMAEHSQPIKYIIRAANKKTFREIHHEIRAAQVEQWRKPGRVSKRFRPALLVF